jgi:hypothetical protein
MKIKKSVFKGLIKECLVEILQEGLGDMLSAPLAKNTSPFAGAPAEDLVDDEEMPEEVDADAEESDDDDAPSFPGFGRGDEEDEEDEETEEDDADSEEEEEEPVQETRRPSKKPILKENAAKRKPFPVKKPVVDRRNERLDHLTRQVASSIKGSNKTKSLFEDIFRDTAKSTLQEQHDRSPASAAVRDFGKHNIIGANPDEIFDGSDRWAKLAYERPKTHAGKR